jgi:acyl-CoA thioester hydrolase
MEQCNLKDFSFQHSLKTRWKDLDAFGHVNNAVFLSYVEDARILFFKRWKINYKERSLIVASAKIDYIKQLKHPTDITIGQKVSRIGTKSFDIKSAIFNQNNHLEPYCITTVTSVCFDFLNNKTVEVYSDIKKDYENK